MRFSLALHSFQVLPVGADEIQEAQRLAWRQVENDSRFVFEKKAGLLHTEPIPADDCVHDQFLSSGYLPGGL